MGALRMTVAALLIAALGCAGKDGAVGPTGPQGPQGEQGPRGESWTFAYYTGDCTSSEPDIIHIAELAGTPVPVVSVFGSTNTYPDVWFPVSGYSSFSDVVFCFVDDEDDEVAIWGLSSSTNYLIIVATPAPAI